MKVFNAGKNPIDFDCMRPGHVIAHPGQLCKVPEHLWTAFKGSAAGAALVANGTLTEGMPSVVAPNGPSRQDVIDTLTVEEIPKHLKDAILMGAKADEPTVEPNIETMTKQQLIDYGESLGVPLNARKAVAELRSELSAALKLRG